MKTNYWLIGLLMGLFLISNVSALGISPGRNSIDFAPGLEREVEFSVVNSDGKNMDIAFTVEGELAEYVTLTNDVESFSLSDSSKSFKYNLKLPQTLSPGLHKADVVVLELPEGLEDSGMVVSATVSVVTQVYVYVPYPGKYIESVFEIVSVEDTNAIEFHIPFVSRGEESIQKISAVVDVFDGDKKIISLDTNSLSVNSKERKELFINWNPDVTPGGYRAVATIDYDGNKVTYEKDFVVGPEEMSLLGISVNDFKLGDVAKIRILVQNRLKETVKSVFANLGISTPELEEISNLKSESYDIPGESNKELIVYWDTEDVEKGLYNSELRIHQDDKTINKNFKVAVSDDAISFTGIGFVVASDGEGKVSMSTILIIVIGLLVLVNLLWFVIWMKNKKSVSKKK